MCTSGVLGLSCASPGGPVWDIVSVGWETDWEKVAFSPQRGRWGASGMTCEHLRPLLDEGKARELGMSSRA